MSQTEKLLYTARTHTVGGRQDGMSRSSDGRLDVRLSPPGSAGIGTNPEQLFAAGWSACFEGAMEIAARKRKIVLPSKSAIDAEIDLVIDEGAYALRARLGVSLPGLDRVGHACFSRRSPQRTFASMTPTAITKIAVPITFT